MSMQERKRHFSSSGDFTSLFHAIGEGACCCGIALAAVALVLALHSFVVFKGQAASFLFVIRNEDLSKLRVTIITAAVLLAWAVADMVYRQTMATDIAMIDWERPQQVPPACAHCA
jgi:Meckelin (Transmembrane protein 67)